MSQQSLSKHLSANPLSMQKRLSPTFIKAHFIQFIAGLLMSAVVAMPTAQNAQAASCKIPKSYYKNVSCTANSRYFFATTDFGAPVALINNQGKRVIDLSRYQQVDTDKLFEGLLPVSRNGRVGYVNMQGREVIPAIYERLKDNQGWARPASEGRIIVKMNGDYGIISTANETIVPFSPGIKEIDNYQGGVVRIRRNQATSWLDKNGKTTRDPNADNEALSASAQQSSSPIQAPFTSLNPHQQDGRWGFVDDNDVTMITYSFDEVKPFSEGLAGVRIDDKWGFVNLGGELVIPFRFDKNGIINENLTAKNQQVSEEATTDNNNGAAFIFKEGKAWVGSLKDGSKLCIDKEGNNVSCD